MAIVKIKINGRVQGVSFRRSTREKALELGICGWVKNEIDGSVSAEAEGELEKLKELISWCKEGPWHASVSDIDYDFFDNTENFNDFIIRF